MVAEGVLTMMIGKLMEWIHVNMLFYSISLLGILMLWIRYYSLSLISEQISKKKEGALEMELLEK